MAMFEGVASKQTTIAGLPITSRAQATSASCLTIMLSFKPISETTFTLLTASGPTRRANDQTVRLLRQSLMRQA
jgi:hypothetical protein